MTATKTNAKPYQGGISAGSSQNDTALVLLALFWPVAGAIAAFFMLHRRVARFVLGAVMVLIGYRLALVDERFDGYRLGEFVTEMAALNVTEFSLWVNQYCFNTEQCIEPIQPFYTFLLTRLSGEPAVAFAGYALLFSFFSISMLSALRCDKTHGSDLFFYFFLFSIMVLNPIHNVSAFRFSTASWTFLLGSYLVFYRGRDIGFGLILLAVAFHYAMAITLVLALILRFVRFPIRFAIILALASFAVSGVIQLVAPLLNNLDYQIGALSRGARYVSEGTLEARSAGLQRATSGSNLIFFYFSQTGIKIALAVWMTYLLIYRNRLRDIGLREARFLSFSITLFAFANAFSEIPSFGRYSAIAIQLLYMGFILCAPLYTRQEKKILLVLFVPAVLFSMLLTLRIAFGLMDIYSMMPSPFLVLPREPLL